MLEFVNLNKQSGIPLVKVYQVSLKRKITDKLM